MDIKYDKNTILEVRENEESWTKTENITKVWKRRVKVKKVYNINEILDINEDDESWITPLNIVKIMKR